MDLSADFSTSLRRIPGAIRVGLFVLLPSLALAQGAQVSVLPPNYTGVGNAPLSIDTNGALRVRSNNSTAVAPGGAAAIATGGTGQVAILAGSVKLGCYISNPPDAAGQGIVTAENLLVDPVNSSPAVGTITTTELVPGASWSCPVAFTGAIYVSAATTGHNINAVQW